jgi:hypothetical protein
MKRAGTLIVLAGAALALSQPAQAASLLVNGSFEGAPVGNTILGGGSTAISGWTTTNQGVEWFTPGSYGLAARDGTAAIDLAWYTSNGTPGGGIAQTFATEVGQTYEISFYGATHAASGRDGTGVIELSVDGGSLTAFDLANPSATFGVDDWQHFTYSFTATGTTTSIEFRNRQNAYQHFAYLDAVSVMAVPEAGTWAMMLVGLGALGGALRRRQASAPTLRTA